LPVSPVPKSFTDTFGFLGSFDAIFAAAVFLPVAEGLKEKLMLHVLPFVKTEQLCVRLNSSALAPVMVMLFIVRSDKPVFLTVTVTGADPLPTGVEPRFTDMGLADILGGGACPESFTLTVDFLGSLETILIAALFLL
jgi:hypothetical protein